MPNFDGFGPWGRGFCTGWGKGGFCRYFDSDQRVGRKYFSKKEEIEILEEEASELEKKIFALKERLVELKA